MRLGIVAVGRLKASPEKELVARYLERGRAGGRGLGLTDFAVQELPEGRQRDETGRREDEAARLLGACAGADRRVVLDETGRALSSQAFAEQLAAWRDAGTRDCAFLIGGPDGHGRAARDRADLTLGFGPMTWPHQLVRVMLAEQLYRAVSILAGHPYHRA